ncbi:acetylxylan esterase [Nannocystis pusilla]|uniref:acetylxylan esterase n=1 Tax=Nannocystis pusilla TaxID=889268 RepID=UPI003DA2D0F3
MRVSRGRSSNVRRQRVDLRQAVTFARSWRGVDPERVALWGTSLGGNHVVEVAASDPRIAAVVLNVPALDAIRGANLTEKRRRANVGYTQVLATTGQLLGAAAIDALRGALGLSPRYIAVYGAPGRAFFTDPALAPRFAGVAAGSPTWQNRVAPRFLFQVPRLRPGTMERITAPLLACIASRDAEVSAAFVKAQVAKARRGEVREYPVDHFETYHGATFEQVAADQLEFLQRHLRP